MSASWPTVRIFVSSTFRDMRAERDHLVRLVFPELRERCARRHLHLIDVDLRWGVTEEEAETGKVLEICLEEIERCRPFFVGILGERFGHVPPSYDIPAGPQYDWLRAFKPEHSITALEIYHGALLNPEMAAHAFFYFRDPSFISTIPDTARGAFLAESDDGARKLAQMKAAIRAKFPVFENYPCSYRETTPAGEALLGGLDQFGQRVLEDLWSAISQEHPEEPVAQDELALERGAHGSFGESRTRHFVGRSDVLAGLIDFVDGSEGGLLALTGPPGIGKSALAASLDRQYRARGDTFVLTHFFGITAASADIRATLYRLCRDLAAHCGASDEIAVDYQSLKKTFADLLATAGKKGRTLLLLDALDQLDLGFGAHSLSWLPHPLPEGVRVVATTLEGECLDALRRREPRPPQVVVGPLSSAETAEIVRQTLWDYRKKLDEARDNRQMAVLLDKREADNPLYLVVACEELRVFGEFENLAARIASFPATTPELLEQVFDRLERDHGKDLVTRALALLECSRHGLLEPELLDLLGETAHAPLPPAAWARLRRALAAFLRGSQGDAGLLTFFHRQLSAAVRRRYLPRQQDAVRVHAALSDYFQAKGDPHGDRTWRDAYARSVSELPFHLTHADRASALKAILTNLRFIDAKCRAGMVYDLVRDYRSASALVQDSEMDAWAFFISRQSELLARFPALAIQQALNEPDDAAAARAALAVVRADNSNQTAWRNVRWLNKPSKRGAEAALLKTFEGAPGAVVVTPDGRYVVSAAVRYVTKPEGVTLQPEMRVHEAATGEMLATLEGADPLVLSPDGRCVFACGWREDFQDIRCWELPSGPELWKVEQDGLILALAVSPDGRFLFSGSDDKTIRVWDLVSRRCVRTLSGHGDRVTVLKTSPDGRWLVSGSWDKCLNVWDIATGRLVNRLRRQRSISENNIAFLSDSRHLVIVEEGQTMLDRAMFVTCLDLTTGSELESSSLPDGRPGAVAISPDDRHIICTSGNPDEIRVIQRSTNTMWVLRHTGDLHDLALPRNGQWAASLGADGTVRLWDWSTPTSTDIHSPDDKVLAMAVSRDGHRVAWTSDQGQSKCEIWDGCSGQRLSTIVIGRYEDSAVAISPDRKRILIGGVSTLKVRDLDTGDTVVRLIGHGGVTKAAISPDGALAATSEGFAIKIWKLHRWRDARAAWWARLLRVPVNLMLLRCLPSRTLSGHEGRTDALAFLPDGRLISAGTDERRSPHGARWTSRPVLRVWDPADGRCLAVLEGSDGALDVSADGRMMASAGSDRTVRLWEVQTLEQIGILPHSHRVVACAFTPDGKRLLTGGWDRVLRIWDLSARRVIAAFPSGGEIKACAATSDRDVVFGDQFGRVYLLHIDGA